MTITIKDAGDAVIYLGAIAAALAAIGVVARVAVLGPVLRWLRKEIQPAVRQTQAATAAVCAEMSPNGGGSMKDAITRIDTEMQALSTRLADHITNHPGPGAG